MKKELTSLEVQDVVKKLELYLKDLEIRWDQEYNTKKTWFSFSKSVVLKSTQFLLNVVDELVIFVEQLIPSGSDKKLAVMAIVEKLFDYIAAQAFPLWLKPFTKTIKNIVISIIISELIDYIVAKYNAGYWSSQEARHGEKNQTK